MANTSMPLHALRPIEFRPSSQLINTPVPTSCKEVRQFYLKDPKNLPTPWIAHSPFIPPSMVEHLMRHKKNEAIAQKFVPSHLTGGHGHKHRPDEITNMEGALHTFVIPIVHARMHGVYTFTYRHDMRYFGQSGQGTWLAMPALMSALVQPDFEHAKAGAVMMALCRLEKNEVLGSPVMPDMPSLLSKHEDGKRAAYDAALRRYMLYHLLPSRRLPPRETVAMTALNTDRVLDFLTKAILSTSAPHIPNSLQNVYLSNGQEILSLDLLFRVILEQVSVEHGLLNRLVHRATGYVYTWNPPSIFAGSLQRGTELLSLVLVLALKYYCQAPPPLTPHHDASPRMQSCRAFAWDTYATPQILPLLRAALGPGIRVCSTGDIYSKHAPHTSSHEGGKNPFYEPPPGCEKAILVVHNNSDAFGQNVETEGGGGSLDAVIGANSSAAGSLLRGRGDLCERGYVVTRGF